MKKVTLGLLTLACFVAVTSAFAQAAGGGSEAVSGIGSVASKVTSNLQNIAKLITAGSYVAGMGFAVAAIIKFKAHKDNPTQIPISAGIVLLFVGAALIFIPTVFGVAGQTLFGKSGTQGGISGVYTFGKSSGGAGG